MPHRIPFTKTALAAIKPPREGRITVYDTKVPKLAARITAAGTRTFYLVLRTPRGMSWLKLGAFGDDTTVEQARTAANAALGQFARGGDPAAAKRAERAQMMLGDAFEAYMERHVAAKGRRRATDLRAMWERCLGDLPNVARKKHAPRERSKHPGGVNWQRRKVNAIARDDVAALHVAIGKTTPTLANRVVELLSAIYNKLRAWGVDVENPARGIEPFKETKRDRFLQRDELRPFFAALAADTSEDFRDFVSLALLTGGRRNNVLGMRWANIDRERAIWRIPATDAKAGSAIDVPLVPEAQAILATRRERAGAASEFVFPAPSQTGHMTPPKKRWAALFDRAELDALAARIVAAGGKFEWKNDGSESLKRALTRAQKQATKLRVDRTGARIADLRLHDLRRSLGSWQTILGASLPIIGRSLGHKSPSATAIYARLDMDPVRESVARATSAMLVAAGVKQSAVVANAQARKSRTKR